MKVNLSINSSKKNYVMIKFDICALDLEKVVQRFYIMMAITIALGFMGLPLVAGVAAMTFAISCILGLRISFHLPSKLKRKESKIVKLEEQRKLQTAG